MTETRADYEVHEHSHDDDRGVPFWQRAAITEGQLAVLRRNYASMQAATFASTFSGMMATVKAVNEANGWWDDGERNKAELLMLAVCELAEAVEALRHGNPQSEHLPQYTGEAEELADAIIRLMDYASRYVPDLGEVITAKVEYNRGRGCKHGKQF